MVAVSPGQSSSPPLWSPSYRWQTTFANNASWESGSDQVLKRSQKLNTISHKQTASLICCKSVNKTFPGWIPGQFWTFAAITCRPLWCGSRWGNSHLQHNDPPHPGKVSSQISVDFQYHHYQATLQWTPGSCFCLAAWSPCDHHAWRLLRICRYLSSTFCARQGLYFLHFSGLLIAGLYIETGPNVQKIVVVHVSVGGLVGLGFGLMYLPAMDIVPHYFDRRCSGNNFQE